MMKVTDHSITMQTVFDARYKLLDKSMFYVRRHWKSLIKCVSLTHIDHLSTNQCRQSVRSCSRLPLSPIHFSYRPPVMTHSWSTSKAWIDMKLSQYKRLITTLEMIWFSDKKKLKIQDVCGKFRVGVNYDSQSALQQEKSNHWAEKLKFKLLENKKKSAASLSFSFVHTFNNKAVWLCWTSDSHLWLDSLEAHGYGTVRSCLLSGRRTGGGKRDWVYKVFLWGGPTKTVKIAGEGRDQ